MTLGGARGFRRGCMLFCHLFRLFDVFYRRKTSNTPLWDGRLQSEVVFPFHSPLNCGITVWGGCVMLISWSYLVHESLLRRGAAKLCSIPIIFLMSLGGARARVCIMCMKFIISARREVLLPIVYGRGKRYVSPHIYFTLLNSIRVCSSFVPVRTWIFG